MFMPLPSSEVRDEASNAIMAATIAFVAVSCRVVAQDAGGAREGVVTAQAFCSECHAVQKGERRLPNGKSPAFVEIANTPGITATALLVALTTPHAGMPMFVLTPAQRAGVIAYILSLKD
jgi:mono/diheme cytochrome c family protein